MWTRRSEDGEDLSDMRRPADQAVAGRVLCSHSCAARKNNIGVRRHGIDPTRSCAFCGTATRNRKYCSSVCCRSHRTQMRWQVEDSEVASSSPRVIRQILISRLGNVCAICHTTRWNGADVSLVLDHVDGHAENWRWDNLRMICPSCDAQLPTYKSRNRGNGRHARTARYRRGLSY